MPLATVPEIISDVKEGKFVIVVDDSDRENEGDLVIAAEKASPAHINFMAKHARGLVCMPVIGQRLMLLNCQYSFLRTLLGTIQRSLSP